MIARPGNTVMLATATLLIASLAGQPTDVPAAGQAKLAWSPDGAWLAFVHWTPPLADSLPAGWLYEPALLPRHALRGPVGGVGRYRLWVVPARDPQRGLLVAESELPLTGPAWRPDGGAIAFGRVVESDLGMGVAYRFELVVHDGDGPDRVIRREDLPPGERVEGLVWLCARTPAWSPDGEILAAPWVSERGIVFVRFRSGRTLRSIQAATAVSWSGDGGRAAFLRSPDTGPAELCWLDRTLGAPQPIATVERIAAIPDPTWSTAGQMLWWVRVDHKGELGPLKTLRVELYESPPQAGMEQPVRSLIQQPITDSSTFFWADWCEADEGEALFFTTHAARQASLITWAFPRRNLVYKRFHPVDALLPLGALAWEPGGRRLAVRVGGRGVAAPVALVEPESEEVRLLVPDAEAGGAWLAVILEATCDLMAGWSRRPEDAGGSSERATILPLPSERSRNRLSTPRLERLSARGLAVWDAIEQIEPRLAGRRAPGLDEARLALLYLAGERDGGGYEPAREALEVLERREPSGQRRLRLGCLRVQIDLGTGERDRARLVIEALRAARLMPGEVIEEWADTRRTSPCGEPACVWLRSLERELDASGPQSGPGSSLGLSGPAGTETLPSNGAGPRPPPPAPDFQPPAAIPFFPRGMPG